MRLTVVDLANFDNNRQWKKSSKGIREFNKKQKIEMIIT